MKVFAWLAGIATLIGSAIYTGVSVGRWEWNRALFFAMVFLAAEVGLATALLLRRLDSSHPVGETSPPELATIRDTRRDHHRFMWLRHDPAEVINRSNVFITLLVGGGVLISGLAWALDKIASATTDRRREAQLARDLGTIRYPEDGLMVDDVTVLAQPSLRRNDPHVRRFLGRDERTRAR